MKDGSKQKPRSTGRCEQAEANRMEKRGEAGAAATGAAAEEPRGQEDGDPEAGRENMMHHQRGHRPMR